jgi:T5orf172 domain
MAVVRRTPKSIAAEAAWHVRLAELGARDGGETWAGTHAPRLCSCLRGHECRPLPHSILQGQGICKTCTGHDRVAARDAWFTALEGFSARDGGGPWMGVDTPRLCWCAEGHRCRPRPASVQQGQGICRVCAGNDPAAAWASFRATVDGQGGTVDEPAWLGNSVPHWCTCAKGHRCRPMPSNVSQGGGICKTCAGHDPASAWHDFRTGVEAQAGRVDEAGWLGSKTPHRCTCAAGHRCRPRPNGVEQGQGLCRVCARNDPAEAEAAWHVRLAELGAADGGEPWAGVMMPRLCRCTAGHECRPAPNSVQQGQGICRVCVAWNVVYVVVNPTEGRVKFGITSGDPRPRLRTHRRRGYTEVARTVERDDAPAVERAILAALAAALRYPIPGCREHFDISDLDLILAVVDSHSVKP